MVILIWDHDKREAPSMTPSNDTIDYFSSRHIPCVAAQRNAVKGMKNSENHYRHNQRLTVMDEPTMCNNQVVYLDDKMNLIFSNLNHKLISEIFSKHSITIGTKTVCCKAK